MDYLWSPWRYQYVTQAATQPGCIFCLKMQENEDERNLVYRAVRAAGERADA